MATSDDNRQTTPDPPSRDGEPPEQDVPGTDHPTGEKQAEENEQTELPA